MLSVRNQADRGSKYRGAMTAKENARHRGAMACVGGLRSALGRPALFLFGRLLLGRGGSLGGLPFRGACLRQPGRPVGRPPGGLPPPPPGTPPPPRPRCPPCGG